MQPLLVGKIAVMAVSPAHMDPEYGGAAFFSRVPAAKIRKIGIQEARAFSQMQFVLPAGSLELSAVLAGSSAHIPAGRASGNSADR